MEMYDKAGELIDDIELIEDLIDNLDSGRYFFWICRRNDFKGGCYEPIGAHNIPDSMLDDMSSHVGSIVDAAKKQLEQKRKELADL